MILYTNVLYSRAYFLSPILYQLPVPVGLVTNVQCQGHESDLSDCRADPWNTNNVCDAGQAVIACSKNFTFCSD